MRKITFFKTMLAAVMLLVGSVGVQAQYVGSGTFTRISTVEEIESGAYYVLYGINASYTGALSNDIAGGRFKATAITPDGNSIVDPATTIVWKVEGDAVNGYTIYNEASDKYCEIVTNSTSGFAANNPSTHTYAVTVADANFTMKSNSATGGNRVIAIYQTDFRPYASGNTLHLYKMPAAVDPTVVINPVIAVSGTEKTPGVYFNNAQVSITTATEGASVYYTTNGETPTTSSTLFSTPFTLNSSATVKAIGAKSGMQNSAVVERVVTIIPPATATIPYTEAFSNTLGDWYAFKKVGERPWSATVNGASVNGYGGGDVESWLISPQFTSPLAGLAFTFNYASRYTGNPLLVKYSTNYAGYGDPTIATWTDLTSIAAPEIEDNTYSVKASGNIIVPVSGTIHLALLYDTDENYSDWRITNASVVVAPAPNTPTITVAEVSVPAMSAEVSESDAKDITVSGVNLTGDITLSITGTNANYFSATPATIAHVSGAVTDVTVAVTYSPLVAGSHTATLTLSSPGAADVTRTLTGSATAPPVPMTPPDVIITEVYGGGGNSGATLKNDFIELYNTTTSAVNISGWSLQYYSSTGTGTATNVFVIPEGKVIPAKGYFLVQAAAGTGGTDDLPTPDAVSSINMAGTAGKIILYTNETAHTISDIASIITNAAFKDYVPFGSATVPVWGSAMPNISNTTSATRKMAGDAYSYTQNIGFDFEAADPSPTNSGLTSVQNPKMRKDVYTVNGSIRFEATAGQPVEVYNVIGQKLVSAITRDGLNIIPINVKGMMVVRIGEQTAKVVL